jgi:hypothetical protein
MEASVAGMPPAAAEQATETVQPTEQVQPQQAEQAPVVPATEGTQQGTEGGMEGAFNEMKASFDQFLQSQKPAEEESLATDLLSHLEGQGETEEVEPGGEQVEPTETEQLQSPEAQAQLQQAQAFIASQVQELVTPLQRELAARDMKALGERYPDINSKEVLAPLTEQINRMVALTGNPDLIYNADFVEQLYKVVKAEQADAAAVPAEQAANQGASLETHAGQSQAGNSSLADQYKEAVYQPPKPSAFG